MNSRPLTRLDFYCPGALSPLRAALAYQRAWKLAAFYRAPLGYRQLLREVMREAALDAVARARREVSQRALSPLQLIAIDDLQPDLLARSA